jgi:hypothetical protein
MMNGDYQKLRNMISQGMFDMTERANFESETGSLESITIIITDHKAGKTYAATSSHSDTAASKILRQIEPSPEASPEAACK